MSTPESTGANSNSDETPAAALPDATRSLMALYQREAYRVYNLALRIAGPGEPALRAAERTFLSAAGTSHGPEDVVRQAVRTALAEAGGTGAGRPSSAGGQEADGDRMLAAIRRLAPPCRAALALHALCQADAAGIGSVLGIASDAAVSLLDRARSQLADALAERPDAAADLYAAWPWADPPTELWERVHAGFHIAQPQPVVPAPEASADDPARRSKRRPRLSRRRPVTLAAGALALLALAAGGAALAGARPSDLAAPLGLSSDPKATPTPAGPGPFPAQQDGTADTDRAEALPGVTPTPAAPKKPLTPEELDRLRLAELRDLERYARRQADTSLSPDQRAAAGREVQRIIDLAQRRADAAERREARLRLQLKRERDLRRRGRSESGRGKRDRNTAPNSSTQPDDGSTVDAAPVPDEPGATPTPSSDPGGDCLYDPDTGAYICEDG